MAKELNMSDPIALDVKQLTVNYDKVPVLWDINFSIPPANIIGIIGPNGAGKSTLIKSILGMLEPLSGKVDFFGQSFKKAKKKIAYVPQRSSVDWDFPITVLEVVMMGLYAKLGLFSFCGTKEKAKAMDALDKVGLSSFAGRQISQLSGGQQQRVFIARALLQGAEIYFMDEPFAGVDMATEQAMIEIIRRLRSEGKTIFIVHHDLNTVPLYFDWLIMLNTSLVACGPIEQVFNQQNLNNTYGKGSFVLDEAAKLAHKRSSGLK